MASLHLIPVPLYSEAKADIPLFVQEKALSLKHYFVENIRTARRALKDFDRSVNIDEIIFEEISKNKVPNQAIFSQWVSEGHDMGLMSEAGCPAVADPGSLLVAWAHAAGVRVHPYTGPNSILLALMASGFDGQDFQFIGYLPIQNGDRSKAIKKIDSATNTQIFIETPFRNNQLLEALCKDLRHSTLLCVAAELTSPTEFILSQSVEKWKNSNYDFHKKPTIFLVGHSSASPVH